MPLGNRGGGPCRRWSSHRDGHGSKTRRSAACFVPAQGQPNAELSVLDPIGSLMSLMHHTESESPLSRLKERVFADFRDTRFTWPGFFRWTGIVVMAFLIAGLITLYFLDWNQMRGRIGRYPSARYGREVRIDENLKVNLFRCQPHVEAGGFYIGNPAWVGEPEGAAIKKAGVEFRLAPAIFGDLK